MNGPRHSDSGDHLVFALGLFAALVVAAPASLLGLALVRAARARRGMALALAVLGLGLTALQADSIAGHVETLLAFSNAPDRATASEVRHQLGALWVATAGLAPLVALVLDAVRPKHVDELQRRREEDAQQQLARREHRARRRVGAASLPSADRSFVLGAHVAGDRLLPVRRGQARMPIERMGKLVLCVGAPGSGKTETLLRLAEGVAHFDDWSVFVIDPKGEHSTMDRFAARMHAAGRRPVLFPARAYDAWRGTSHQVANRLIELIDWSDEGGGTYYRDIASNLIHLACRAPQGPPRSSGELLERLRPDALAQLAPGGGAGDFKAEDITGCRHRYQAFFAAVGDQLDGDFAFEDADCGYLLLDELSYGEETSKLARLLLQDFQQYLAARKPRERKTLLIIDEFSAIASGERTARLAEVIRSYGGSLVLAPQAYEGMGGIDAAARIVSAAHTILLHALPEPDRLVSAAGTKMGIETSVQHDQGRSLHLGSAREQHQHKVAPNDVRRLTPGMCFAIGSGRAQKIQVLPIPAHTGPLPPIDGARRPEPRLAEAPEEPLRL